MFNSMLKTQKGIAQELHDEINLVANKLLTPNYVETLPTYSQHIFYQFPVIEDILYSLISHEKRFLKLCEERIRHEQKMTKLCQLQQLNIW